MQVSNAFSYIVDLADELKIACSVDGIERREVASNGWYSSTRIF
jgi:hypothetical protein